MHSQSDPHQNFTLNGGVQEKLFQSCAYTVAPTGAIFGWGI